MKYMKYELKDEYLIKDEKGEVMAVSLPVVGEIPVSTKALSLAKASCDILEGKASGGIPCLLLRGGWLGFFASGDAIITMHHMRYDFQIWG